MLGREVANVPNPDPKQYSFIAAFLGGMLVWWWAQTCPSPPPPHPTVQTYVNFRKFAKFYLRSIKTYHFQTFTIFKALFPVVSGFGFSVTGPSQKLKSPWKSPFWRNFMISFNSHKLINKTLRPRNDILIFLWSWHIVFLFIIILRMCSLLVRSGASSFAGKELQNGV